MIKIITLKSLALGIFFSNLAIAEPRKDPIPNDRKDELALPANSNLTDGPIILSNEEMNLIQGARLDWVKFILGILNHPNCPRCM